MHSPACGLAVLAGLGLHAWLAEPDRRRRLWQLAGPLVVARGARQRHRGRAADVPARRARPQPAGIRARAAHALRGDRGRQPAGDGRRAPGWPTSGDDGRAASCSWRSRPPTSCRPIAASTPAFPRDRYYPITDSLDWLREQASETRIAPVDTAADLIEGHVWGMYGLSTVTGFDFHGDADYQHFMRLAQQPPGTDVRGAARDVGLRRPPPRDAGPAHARRARRALHRHRRRST